ncbi:hypothetical protein GUITHDRAFT_133284 [Guillardia theta CCMP2712]|uniref:Glycosyltransferase 2-like domain-containing protein n=2 Tax=Guillardia theta TaxID=55529 RepID=L1JWC1_GUITC|nr:hypothetical protein GUITHDRAFT_133284 [Guillardia theta CCMP2712]EKX52861.1 hypothetical protein GUITHDRAFT_133284 [Guillardia theta CCMP2712]|eukprot:XP_005839841.1 hypothetical protein GUITHDRAFT_133284 [Guillardia theta CCMP2712]
MVPEEEDDKRPCPRQVGLPACRSCRVVGVTDGIVSSSCVGNDLLEDDRRQEQDNSRISLALLADWQLLLLSPFPSAAQEKVTVTITSCGRPALLAETIRSFLAANTHPIEEVLVIEDSGNATLCRQLQATYMSNLEAGEEEPSGPPFRILCNKERVGQVVSLDRVTQHVRTDFVFHLEDDWTCDGTGNFIQDSLEILRDNPNCFQVHLRHRKSMTHPVHPQLFLTSRSSIPYRRLVYGWYAGDGLYWHGLSFGPGLRRKSHMLLLSPFESLGSELQAQAAFYSHGLWAAALEEGVMEHTGDSDSKREEWERRD